MPKISFQEAQARTGLSERTLRRYVDVGLLPAYRLGAKFIRVDTDDLDHLLQPISSSESMTAA